MVPPIWFDEAAVALGVAVAAWSPVSGGDINDAYRLQLENGELLFAKVARGGPSAMFSCEAAGLSLLREVGSELAIPRVVYESTTCLVMEYLKPTRRDQSESFGRGLAQLHAPVPGGSPGGASDGFIGTLPQINHGKQKDWWSFFAEERLRYQLNLPAARRLVHRGLRAKIERLIERMFVLFSQPVALCHLHGDLWSGNYMFSEQGPAIFDPAPYLGHREVDLAMMELFGGFSERTYRSYFEVHPVEEGYRERILLYQIYPLLVHVNLFGGSYVASVERNVDQLL